MAKEQQSFHKNNFPNLKTLTIGVALVCVFQLHHLSGIECGSDDYDDVLITERTIGGDHEDRERRPFIAALYHTKQSKYFCEGILISNRHILTPAHCIQEKGSDQKLSNGDIEVRLGAYNRTAKCEKKVVMRNVTEINVHPDWIVNNDDYDADLAILVLSDSVVFTTHIQPISLPAEDFVVNGSSINVNVNVNDNIDDTWRQYGIISIRKNKTGNVSRTLVSVYTNVQSFQRWIRETMIGMKMINLECKYLAYYVGYGCLVERKDFPPADVYVASVNGSHLIGQNDQNVEVLYFYHGTMLYVPYGLGERFKHLRSLDFGYCLNTKLITRSNLQNLKNLVKLSFYNNDEIEQLQFDSLWDVTALERFELSNCKLKVVDERMFEKNSRLREVYLGSNKLEFLPQNIFKNNFQLKEIDFSYNSLKNIEIDVTPLRNLKNFDLVENICIDARYYEQIIPYLYPLKQFTNISAFQQQIKINCSSKDV